MGGWADVNCPFSCTTLAYNAHKMSILLVSCAPHSYLPRPCGTVPAPLSCILWYKARSLKVITWRYDQSSCILALGRTSRSYSFAPGALQDSHIRIWPPMSCSLCMIVNYQEWKFLGMTHAVREILLPYHGPHAENIPRPALNSDVTYAPNLVDTCHLQEEIVKLAIQLQVRSFMRGFKP